MRPRWPEDPGLYPRQHFNVVELAADCDVTGFSPEDLQCGRLTAEGRVVGGFELGWGEVAEATVAAAKQGLQPLEDGQPLLVVATGHFVGEGFDCPALDSLFPGRAGRLQRSARPLRRSCCARASG